MLVFSALLDLQPGVSLLSGDGIAFLYTTRQEVKN